MDGSVHSRFLYLKSANKSKGGIGACAPLTEDKP